MPCTFFFIFGQYAEIFFSKYSTENFTQLGRFSFFNFDQKHCQNSKKQLQRGLSWLILFTQGHSKVIFQSVDICNFYTSHQSIIVEGFIEQGVSQLVDHDRGAPRWPFGPGCKTNDVLLKQSPTLLPYVQIIHPKDWNLMKLFASKF